MNLRTGKGKEAIIVWRRSSWVSMPHLRFDDSSNLQSDTRCGREVILGYGITGITMTQIPVDLFLSVGCGHCRSVLLRDLRDELLANNPYADKQWKEILRKLEWTGVE